MPEQDPANEKLTQRVSDLEGQLMRLQEESYNAQRTAAFWSAKYEKCAALTQRFVAEITDKEVTNDELRAALETLKGRVADLQTKLSAASSREKPGEKS